MRDEGGGWQAGACLDSGDVEEICGWAGSKLAVGAGRGRRMDWYELDDGREMKLGVTGYGRHGMGGGKLQAAPASADDGDWEEEGAEEEEEEEEEVVVVVVPVADVVVLVGAWDAGGG